MRPAFSLKNCSVLSTPSTRNELLPAMPRKVRLPEVAVVAHAGCQQDERVDAAAVDRQIVDLPGVDDLRDVGLGVLDQGRGGGDLHLCGRAGDGKCHAQVEILADGQVEIFPLRTS